MVRVQLIPDKLCLSHFHLGQSLYGAVETVRLHLPHHRAQLLNDPSFPNSTPIYLRVFDSDNEVFTLTFDPESQSLTSLSYLLPGDWKGVVIEIVRVGIEGSLHLPVSASDLTAVCGEPLGCHSDDSGNVMLEYQQVYFVFKQFDLTSQLVKIEMGESRLSSHFNLSQPLNHISQIQTNFIVDGLTSCVNGLALIERSPFKRGTQECEDEFIATVRFGDQFEDIVSKLGTPSSVYYKDNHHPSHVGSVPTNSPSSPQVSLSYSRLGIDIILDAQRGMVTKFVLHANVPDHYQFCSYARCFFRFSVTPLGLATSDECRDSLLVTPMTSWQVLESYINHECFGQRGKLHCSPSTNYFYPFPNTNLHSLFHQVIVETTVNDDIVTLTLLSSNCQPWPYGLLNHSLHGSGEFAQREVCVIRNTPIVSQCSSEEEEFFDCEDDAFHSATTSVGSDIVHGLVGTVSEKRDSDKSGEAAPVSTGVSLECGKRKHEAITMKHTVLFGPNVNVVTRSIMPRDQNIKNDAVVSILYEFVEDGTALMTDKDSEDVIYKSESMMISLQHNTAGDVLRENYSTHGDVFELNSFDFISYPEVLSTSENQSETECNRFIQPSATPQEKAEEPEFIYQPKCNAEANISMTSSRTLYFTKPISSQQEKRNHMMAHTKSSQQRVREKYTESVEIQNSEENSQSQISDQFGPVESTGRDTGPVESTDRDTGPVESTGRDTGPVESTGRDTGPVESTGRDTGPVESTGRDTGPVESTGRDTGPVESTGRDTGPVESTGRDTGPVESTGRDTGPVESTGRDTGPVESTGRDTGPVESTGIDTGPVESTGRYTGPVESTGRDTGPVESTGRDTGPGRDSGPVESIGRDTGPVESTGRDTGPVESTGRDTGPVESTGRDTGPVESTGRDTGPVESTGRDTGPVESTGRDTGPVESTGRDTGPVESTGRDTGPVESTGRDTGPVESTGIDTGPVESTGRYTGPVESTGRDTGPVESTGRDTGPGRDSGPVESIDREDSEDRDTTFLVPLISEDVESRPFEGTVIRCQWTGDEFTPESGPPSMTQERVLEELITCEHEEVCAILKKRNLDLLSVCEAALKQAKPTNLCELSRDVTVPTSLIRAINESDGWTLSMSANMLPWIHELLVTESDTSCLVLLTQAVLDILNNHTLMILKHKFGRARSLSQLQRIQCTACYMTLEKIDQSVDNLTTRLVEQKRGRDSKKCEEELLGRLRDARGHLSKLFRKLELQ